MQIKWPLKKKTKTAQDGGNAKPKNARIQFKLVLPGAKKTAAKKYLSGPRFVFFIGDDGAILLHMKDNVVISRQFVPDASAENLEELRSSLEVDMEAPISLVIDNFDQTYVQQTLPPVSSMSVKKLMKRRLDRDFANSDIKGTVLLGREKTGRKDWNFLMVAVEKSPQITMWLDFVNSLPNRFMGIYLVSTEAEVVIQHLEQAMGVPKGGTGAQWKFFVSHNKVGGFRQVILRDGHIIFTRMAQPIGESTPEVIAGNIEQEMQSTIEYMRRLSFDPEDGLDIYIIAGSAIKPVLDKNKFGVCNFNFLTPYETAQYLGIEGATQPTDQFGDVILAACISSNRKHALTFDTPESKNYDLLYNIFRFQRVLAAVLMLFVVVYVGSLCLDLFKLYEASDELGTATRQRQSVLDNLKEEIKKSGLDIYKTGDVISLYQLLQAQKVSPIDFIAKVRGVVTPPIVVKSIDWVIDDGASKGAGGKPKTTATLILEFPQVQTIESWRTVSKKLFDDLKPVFAGFDISFSKVPNKFLETEKIDITFDNPASSKPSGNENNEVQLTIKEQ